MTIWEAILLGVLQGLTEFLPVSSSGHLELAERLFGMEGQADLPLVMAVHAGTVVSTVVVFWREIGVLLRGVFAGRLNDQTAYAVNLLVSMVPIVFVGLFFKEQIEGLFSGSLLMLGCMLLVTALLLFLSGRMKSGSRPLTPQRAFMIGIAQALAVVPGLSRSGATISTGLMLGLDRGQVARFSFLMVLVPIIGANLVELMSGDFARGALGAPTLLAGFAAAFVSGMLACRWMVRIVSRGRLIWFAGYCAVVGIVTILLS